MINRTKRILSYFNIFLFLLDCNLSRTCRNLRVAEVSLNFSDVSSGSNRDDNHFRTPLSDNQRNLSDLNFYGSLLRVAIRKKGYLDTNQFHSQKQDEIADINRKPPMAWHQRMWGRHIRILWWYNYKRALRQGTMAGWKKLGNLNDRAILKGNIWSATKLNGGPKTFTGSRTELFLEQSQPVMICAGTENIAC